MISLSTTFWIQFLGIIFGLAMLYFTFLKFKRKEINNFERWIWSVGWAMLILLAITPHLLDPVIGYLNFYRALDFFVVLGFFVLLGVGFYNYSSTKKLEKKLEKFVRKKAIEDAEKKHVEQ